MVKVVGYKGIAALVARSRRELREMHDKRDGKHGWDADGNCVWCGEAGRCECDHRVKAVKS